MPTIELIAEIELLKKRAERAAHMSALWKSLAKMHRYSVVKIYEPQLDAQLKTICELQTENVALKKQLDDTEAAARMYCERTVNAEDRLEALKKDARLLAERHLQKVGDDCCTCEDCEAARRIIEATQPHE